MRALEVRVHFDAAHKLNGYEGPCANYHGHRWEALFSFVFKDEEIDTIGLAVDFKCLKKDLNEIVPDHLLLNDVFNFNPTAENISKYLYDKVKEIWGQLQYVKLFESPDCACTYYEVNK